MEPETDVRSAQTTNSGNSRRFNMQKVFDKDLLPFFALVVVYFIIYNPVLQLPPENLTAAFFKVLPVWYLLFFVYFRSYRIQQDKYARHFICGLLASSLGDASLIWREALFIPGMIFFAVAHIFYLFGLSKTVNRTVLKRTQTLFALIYFFLYLFISFGIENHVMKTLVFIYSGCIVAVGWLATARYLHDQSMAGLFGVIGAFLFTFSDFIIATNKWRFPVPLSGLLIMISYYSAQLCLTLSTVHY
ncbi:lysoplasmalogenase-like protein TMEM86A [Gigantopelta aegis]|uniref:lysoplasmalogenase-like protein TMEM86A n=1 Tax=Gigantopelta aegis TaxID=1735272 RepID=UPI001B88AE22|nr:lysoplasmalogenase-like protein TMEM86A [Gigantopelta aegis]